MSCSANMLTRSEYTYVNVNVLVLKINLVKLHVYWNSELLPLTCGRWVAVMTKPNVS